MMFSPRLYIRPRPPTSNFFDVALRVANRAPAHTAPISLLAVAPSLLSDASFARYWFPQHPLLQFLHLGETIPFPFRKYEDPCGEYWPVQFQAELRLFLRALQKSSKSNPPGPKPRCHVGEVPR